MRKWNLSAIMKRAWTIFRRAAGEIKFAEALHRAWNSEKAAPMNRQRIETAKATAGITEQVETWAGWKKLGYEVIHGSKCLFQAVLLHSSKGDGATYRASFFGLSQVHEVEAATA